MEEDVHLEVTRKQRERKRRDQDPNILSKACPQ
jgi:hypothetical protein